MKIDRQIAILSILLQRKLVTAPYLAEKLEVSRRTINRDIEDLCRAGIPIVTRQGVNGGISIMDNYKIDKTLFTDREMQDILAALRSLDSVNGTNRYGQLMEKLSVGSSDFMVGNQSVLIDLSAWNKKSLTHKIELIRTGIDTCRQIRFVYYSPKGESVRCIEPYYMIFRWAGWYVWGWCTKRKDFRLFKLNRMDQIEMLEPVFEKRQVPMPDLSDEAVFPGRYHVKAVFEPECKWRLVEEFGTDCFREMPDGRLLFESDYSDNENLLLWIVSFREKAELLEPKEIRQEIKRSIECMQKKYNDEEKIMRYTWGDFYRIKRV